MSKSNSIIKTTNEASLRYGSVEGLLILSTYKQARSFVTPLGPVSDLVAYPVDVSSMAYMVMLSFL